MEQGSGPIVVAGKYTLVERLDASGIFETYRATDSSGRDYQALLDAVKSGRLAAQQGV
jgi:hypothetical protein